MPDGPHRLFFHDEAVAFAAGHRPCALCRRADYHAYRAAWATPDTHHPSHDELDHRLHAERLIEGTRVAELITPPSTLAVLQAGYPVQLDAASD